MSLTIHAPVEELKELCRGRSMHGLPILGHMRDIRIAQARAFWERLQTQAAGGGQSRTMWLHSDGHEERAGVTFRTRDEGFVLQHHSRVPV